MYVWLSPKPMEPCGDLGVSCSVCLQPHCGSDSPKGPQLAVRPDLRLTAASALTPATSGPLCRSLSLSLDVFLVLFPSFSLSLSFSLFHSQSFSISPNLSLPLPLFLSMSLCRTSFPSLSLTFYPSLSISICLSLSPSARLL